MKDIDFLIWLHERLENVHNENHSTDYMLKLRSIIENYDSEKNTHNNQGDKNMKCEKCSKGKIGMRLCNYSFCPFCGKSLKDQTVIIGNLMWQAEDDWIKRNWQEAIEYAKNLTLDGHSGWRLPTINELISIVDYGKSNPAINNDYFPDCKSYYYWSNNKNIYNDILAWCVCFAYGSVNSYHNKNKGNYVRCVRDIS